MTLGELKRHIESFPEGTAFTYSLSEPFSWRGVYSEVAFTIEEKESTKEEILNKVGQALSEVFIGYKGGEYYYNKNTDIHFEDYYGAYSDGCCTERWISKILDLDPAKSPEHRLINLLFPENS